MSVTIHMTREFIWVYIYIYKDMGSKSLQCHWSDISRQWHYNEKCGAVVSKILKILTFSLLSPLLFPLLCFSSTAPTKCSCTTKHCQSGGAQSWWCNSSTWCPRKSAPAFGAGSEREMRGRGIYTVPRVVQWCAVSQ